jgi:hypothetical protein
MPQCFQPQSGISDIMTARPRAATGFHPQRSRRSAYIKYGPGSNYNRFDQCLCDRPGSPRSRHLWLFPPPRAKTAHRIPAAPPWTRFEPGGQEAMLAPVAILGTCIPIRCLSQIEDRFLESVEYDATKYRMTQYRSQIQRSSGATSSFPNRTARRFNHDDTGQAASVTGRDIFRLLTI